MNNLHVINHPIIENKISILRDIKTDNKKFRELVEELSTLVCYEAMRDISLKQVEIETPLGKFKLNKIKDKKYVIVPILRAGMGMLEGILKLIPNAKVGHIGLYRNEKTLKPVEYYCKLPKDIEDANVLLADPMLATGGTILAAVTFLKNKGIKKIKILNLISCPESINFFKKEHPDIHIYTAAYDKCLNDRGYIIPGLGDAGDRLYGTK